MSPLQQLHCEWVWSAAYWPPALGEAMWVPCHFTCPGEWTWPYAAISIPLSLSDKHYVLSPGMRKVGEPTGHV